MAELAHKVGNGQADFSCGFLASKGESWRAGGRYFLFGAFLFLVVDSHGHVSDTSVVG